MAAELIRYQRDKNSGELYATLPNGKCPRVRFLCKGTAGEYLCNRYIRMQGKSFIFFKFCYRFETEGSIHFVYFTSVFDISLFLVLYAQPGVVLYLIHTVYTWLPQMASPHFLFVLRNHLFLITTLKYVNEIVLTQTNSSI